MRHPHSLVAPWSPWLPPQIDLPTPTPADFSLRPFARIYDEVSDELREYCVTRGLAPNEQDLVEYLISAFYVEFLKWPRDRRPRSYVRFFYQKTSFTLFRLFAHAYLHIVWDLTRCVADAINPALPIRPGLVAPTRERAFEVFANANYKNTPVNEVPR